MERWNALVEEFGQQVNFIWIANEGEAALELFLQTQPFRGWLLLDSEEESYSAYGIEGGDGVLIDARGIIAGFTSWFIRKEPIEAMLSAGAIELKSGQLQAEPHRTPPPQPRPDFPPAEEVRVSASGTHGTVSFSGPDHWIRQGFDLKTIVAEISRTDPSRVEMPAGFDNDARWDFVLVPPREEDYLAMHRRVREAIEKHFRVAISTEARTRDVYVMLAIEGKTPQPKPEGWMGGVAIGISSSSFTDVSLAAGVKPTEEILRQLAEWKKRLAKPTSISSIHALNASMDDFRRALEPHLGRPIVDETGLTGRYDLATEGESATLAEFLAKLRDQFGLLLTPAERTVETIVVRAAN